MDNAFDHLNALLVRLSNEKMRLYNETTPAGRLYRKIWVEQIENEIDAEMYFLNQRGYDVNEYFQNDLTDEELLKELLE